MNSRDHLTQGWWSENLARSTKWQLGFLLIISICTFLIKNGVLEPDIMEARNFITAREMLEGGNWLLPTMNGEYRLAKPPYPTWITALMAESTGDLRQLTALRFPAGLMALLMAVSLFGLGRIFSKEKAIPLLAACVMCTSFYVLFMARRGTWDIYCHSFMLAAIWAFTFGLKVKGSAYKWFTLSGFLMGMSFMSKGPVAFYAVLLPYLLAYLIAFGIGEFRLKYREIAVCLGLCVVISSWWPVYTFLQIPEETAKIIGAEAEAWQQRRVKPFWHYWSFPVQSGIWTLFIVMSLIPGYARRRVENVGGNYKFLFCWVILTILLLSIIPEKKERYLMPGLISQSLLVAYILGYLITQAYENLTRSDKVLLGINFTIFILLCLLGPIVLYRLTFNEGWISWPVFFGFSLTLLLIGALMLMFFLQHQIWPSTIMTFILVATLCIWLPEIYSSAKQSEFPDGNSENAYLIDAIKDFNCYSVGVLRPEELWDIGKIVRPIDLDDLKDLPGRSVVFVDQSLLDHNDLQLLRQSPADSIGVFKHPANSTISWSVYQITI